ncbi:hypothetical protein ACQPZJ_06545 [Actinoplanes sp. CA-054009]
MRSWRRPLGDVAAIVSIGSFGVAHDNRIVRLLCVLAVIALMVDLISIPISALRKVTLVAPPAIALSPGDDLKLVVGPGVLDINVGGRRYRAEFEDGDAAGEAMVAVRDELTAGRAITDLNAFLRGALVFGAVSR